jgi:hypothetical protein
MGKSASQPGLGVLQTPVQPDLPLLPVPSSQHTLSHSKKSPPASPNHTTNSPCCPPPAQQNCFVHRNPSTHSYPELNRSYSTNSPFDEPNPPNFHFPGRFLDSKELEIISNATANDLLLSRNQAYMDLEMKLRMEIQKADSFQ